MHNAIKILLLSALFVTSACACGKVESGESGNGDKEGHILGPAVDSSVLACASKPLNPCETLKTDWMHGYSWSASNFDIRTLGVDRKEGEFCYYITYDFGGFGTGEYLYLKQEWKDWRSDFSFEPYGISFWIKGAKTNAGSLRVVLLQDSQWQPDSQTIREEYEYTNHEILQNGDWFELVIPFTEFTPVRPSYGDIQLSRIIGYRIEFVNTKNTIKSGNIVYIDDIRQRTTFDVESRINRNARFNSIFIQLARDYASVDAESWESKFREIMSIGINEMIIQYCIGFGNENGVSWYSDSKLPWVGTCYETVDRMVEAAEKCGFKLVFGLYGGDYGDGYDNLIARNKSVIDEIYSRFGSSPAFKAWYITEEFHDGFGGWQRDDKREALASYLQAIGAYCKSRKNVDVIIAPAIWRGMAADKCGEWFSKLFAKTPDVDILYIQDCGGRGGLEVTCPTVDLPNWYRHLKKACDDNGVKFGVDLESFRLLSDGMSSLPREWDYLKYQLYVAGMYTDYITNFSWISFRPGDENYEAYRKTIKK